MSQGSNQNMKFRISNGSIGFIANEKIAKVKVISKFLALLKKNERF